MFRTLQSSSISKWKENRVRNWRKIKRRWEQNSRRRWPSGWRARRRNTEHWSRKKERRPHWWLMLLLRESQRPSKSWTRRTNWSRRWDWRWWVWKGRTQCCSSWTENKMRGWQSWQINWLSFKQSMLSNKTNWTSLAYNQSKHKISIRSCPRRIATFKKSWALCRATWTNCRKKTPALGQKQTTRSMSRSRRGKN